MNINHPDIEKFITIKNDLGNVTKANISVKITDKFMKAVEEDSDFELYFRREETGEEIKKTVRARDLFRLICKNAWDNAEPGVLFWDRITNYNLMQYDDNFKIAGTNPCGEIPLPAGGACLLGSINLAEFVKEDKSFDFEEFDHTVFYTIQALDEVLSEGMNLHPLQEQRDTVENWRAIGLGIMGLADMLIKMEIVYGSQESLDLCDKIGYRMAHCAINQSIEDAEKKRPFDMCDEDAIITSEFFQKHKHPTASSKVLESGIRNGQLLCTAPTGTLSTMLNISGGIEPIFDKYYERTTETLNKKKKVYKVYTQIVWDYMQEHGISEDDDDKLPEWFVTSKDIHYKDRIKMQAVWQSHMDNSISSTVNLPENTTVEEVMDLYYSAWKEGCKGITIFREGCRRVPILDSGKKKTEKQNEKNTDQDRKYLMKNAYQAWKEYINGRNTNPTHDIKSQMNEAFGLLKDNQKEYATAMDISKLTQRATKFADLKRGEIIKTPENSIGKNRTLNTGCGTLHCQAFFNPETGELLETYLSKGSTGGCNNFMVGLSRMISLSARAGVSIHDIVDQLKSSGSCPSYTKRRALTKDCSKGSSCPVAVGYALIDMYNEIKEEIDLGGVYKGSQLWYQLKNIERGEELIEERSISQILSEARDIILKELIKEKDNKLEKEILGDCKSKEDDSVNEVSQGICPDCGGLLTFEGGCNTCKQCGWSGCD